VKKEVEGKKAEFDKKDDKMDSAQPFRARDTPSVPWPHQGKRRKASAGQVAQWLKDLGAASYKVREHASRVLVEVGQPAVKGLEEAARADDLEVQRRARQLLERIELAEALAPSFIDVTLKDTPVPAAVEAISRQSRLKLELVPRQGPAREQLEQRKISLELDSVPFWEALDSLCREGGLVPISADLGSLQLQLAEGKPHHPPLAHSGPFRMRLSAMNYYRSLNFGGVGQPAVLPHRTESLTVSMEVTAEPHLTITSMSKPTITEATDEAGQSLALPAGGGTAISGQAYFGPGMASMQFRQTQFSLRPANKPSAKLKTLRGTVPVVIIAPHKPLLTVDDVMTGKARIIKGEGGLVLVILQVQDHGGGRSGNIRFFLSGIDADASAKRGSGRSLVPFAANSNQMQQRFQLTDAQGRRLNANINLSSFNNSGNERSLEGNLYFNAGPNHGPAARLTYSNNQILRTAVPFEFRDAPMP
jgi:hypothetical protein